MKKQAKEFKRYLQKRQEKVRVPSNKQFRVPQRSTDRKHSTLYFALGIVIVVVILLVLQSRYGFIGKAIIPSSECLNYWEDYCYETECTEPATVQCQAYCAEKTSNRCVTGSMPVPES